MPPGLSHLCTYVGRVWPIRWTLPTAWASTPGSSRGSTRSTCCTQARAVRENYKVKNIYKCGCSDQFQEPAVVQPQWLPCTGALWRSPNSSRHEPMSARAYAKWLQTKAMRTKCLTTLTCASVRFSPFPPCFTSSSRTRGCGSSPSAVVLQKRRGGEKTCRPPSA